MTLPTAVAASDPPVAPPPRATSGYVIDAVAMAVYIAAITAACLFLGVPHPLVTAGAIALASLAICGGGGRRSRKARGPSSTP